MATKIVIINKGAYCPNCNTLNNFGKVNVEDENGKICTINAFGCDCGTVYVNKKIFPNCSRGPYLYMYVNGNIAKPLKKKKKKKIVKRSNVSIDRKDIHYCKICGKIQFMETGLCWDCYKYEMEKMYG